MNESSPVMEVRGLSKAFGKVLAVDAVSFSLNPGEVHGFIGPNGAGKTTTMRIMAGVESPDAGEVVLDGISVTDNPDQCRRHIGFMPDYLDAYPNIIVGEYLDFYSRIYGQRPERRKARLADVVEFVGLGDMLDRPVDGLSKGWTQRLSLARVLLNDPKVLILDEPAAGLDPRARIELRDLVNLLAKSGKTVFISSHILTELSEMCQSVTIIENGRLRISSAVSSLRRQIDQGQRMAISLVDSNPDELRRLALFLSETPGVVDSRVQAAGVSFSHDGSDAFKAELLARTLACGFSVTEFRNATSSLEDAFIIMTNGSDSGGADAGNPYNRREQYR